MHHHTLKRPYLNHYLTFYYEYMPKVEKMKKKAESDLEDLHKKFLYVGKGKK